jgi:hypothetical protein
MGKNVIRKDGSGAPIYNFFKPSIVTATLPVTVSVGSTSAAEAVVGGWGVLIQCTEDCGIKQGTADTVAITDVDEDGVIRILAGGLYALELDKTTTHLAHKRVSLDGKLNIIYVQKIES